MAANEKDAQRRLTNRFNAGGKLLAGLGLLVLAGMNLFTNLLQFQNGEWQQNILLAILLTVLFSAVPGWFGSKLVFSAMDASRPPR